MRGAGQMDATGVVRLPAGGPALTPSVAREAIGEALGTGASVVVVPVERLDPAFVDLSTGVAGDIVQAFVNYGIRLVVVGRLPAEARTSRSFEAFVREANRGRGTWLVASEGELEERLRAGT